MYYRISEPLNTDALDFLGLFSPSLAKKFMTARMEKAMKKSLDYMIVPIRTLTPFRTGDLRRSETIAPIQIFEDVVRGEIFSDIHYAQYVEPWARMFFRGSDVSMSEVEKIFNEEVGSGIKEYYGMWGRRGRLPIPEETGTIFR